jgi:outer membrane lipopolysaccharide assembly protein LptE/RlpB
MGLYMINKFKLFVVIAVTALLTACGGGGGGGVSVPVASTESFNLKTVWANTLTSSSSNNYTISGTVSGVAVSGSGTVTRGNLSAGTFEGLPAQQRTTTATGSVVVNGVTVALNTSSIDWVDSNYVPKGESGGEDYVVVTGTPTIPTTVRINDTGTLYTANRYFSSTKAVLRGTSRATYVVEADTSSTALVTLIIEEKNTSNVTTSTSSAQFRITTAGAFTRIKETLVEGTSTLIVTY